MKIENGGNKKLIALLRGINVGGHHKVPMAVLHKEMERLGFSKIVTLLNTGNVIFETRETAGLETKIEDHLQKTFGFAVPVLLRSFEEILGVVKSNPFEAIEVTDSIRLYVTFLKNEPKNKLNLPYISKDESFRIIAVENRMVFSVLDLSKGKNINGMGKLEQLFGKEVTTRNWNTVIKLTSEQTKKNRK